MTRKKSRLLAAIMLTDMVGYVALMQKDEHKSIELDPLFVPEHYAFASSLLGGLHVPMKQTEKAREYLEQELTEKETFPGLQVSFHLSYLYAALNQPDKMFHYLNKCI